MLKYLHLTTPASLTVLGQSGQLNTTPTRPAVVNPGRTFL